jgi:hypothetical protein
LRPLLDLLSSVVKSYPGIFVNPVVDVLYLVVLGLVAAQYARVQSLEERVYGRPVNKAFNQTVASIGLGLLGGLVASVLLVLVGVTVTDSGVGYLLPVALVLFLFSPRFLCFSYAGGLVSIGYLILGWPRVNVAAIAALVACLHAAESFLISISGESCATPLYIQGSEGRTVGAFSLQRFWPIPLIVLFLIKVPDISELTGLISLPDWWPLVRAPEVAGIGTPVFQMMPIVAALGYGDIALSRSPREKVRSTSRHLFLYSAILLGFAIAASRWTAFAWVAALFGPVGHEVVIRVGTRDEMEREPRYVSPQTGVMVLDVFDKGPAHRAGIRRGCLFIESRGLPIRSRRDLEDALKEPGDVVFDGKSPGSLAVRQFTVPRNGAEPIGVIIAPGLGDQAFVTARTDGPLLRLLKKAFNRI